MTMGLLYSIWRSGTCKMIEARTGVMSIFAHVINKLPLIFHVEGETKQLWDSQISIFSIESWNLSYWFSNCFQRIFGLGSSSNCGLQMVYKNHGKIMTTYLSRRFEAETAGETPRWHLSWASCCWYPANCCHFLVRSGEDMGNMGPVTGALSSLPDHQSIHHPWVLVDLCRLTDLPTPKKTLHISYSSNKENHKIPVWTVGNQSVQAHNFSQWIFMISKQFLDFLSLLPLQWFGDLSILFQKIIWPP